MLLLVGSTWISGDVVMDPDPAACVERLLLTPCTVIDADVVSPPACWLLEDVTVPDVEPVCDEDVSDEEVSDEEVTDEEVTDEEVTDEEVTDEEVSDEVVSDEVVDSELDEVDSELVVEDSELGVVVDDDALDDDVVGTWHPFARISAPVVVPSSPPTVVRFNPP
jgi:hypothetical protein